MTGIKIERCITARIFVDLAERANQDQPAMQIETIGKYQLHLIANELSSGGWDPFVTIFVFDESIQDFRCVLEKHHAAEQALDHYDDAIEAAQRVGTAWIEEGKLGDARRQV